MRRREYDDIADCLHRALVDAGPPEDYESGHIYFGVSSVMEGLTRLFSTYRNFDRERFQEIIEKGARR